MIIAWSKLAKHYDEAALNMSQWEATHNSMANLCRYIDKSPLSGGLYGHTSHHTLRIAQIEYEYPPSPTIPLLTIAPVSNHEVEFCYLDTRIEERQWRRTTSPNGVIDQFKKAIVQLSWSTVGIL